MVKPAAPARDGPRALLLGEAGHSEPGDGPHDEETQGCQDEADWNQDAAQD